MTEETIKPRGSIDKYVLPYIGSLPDLTGKVAVDIPSGEGRASAMFARRGATVRAFDLFPEFTNVEGVHGDSFVRRMGKPTVSGADLDRGNVA